MIGRWVRYAVGFVVASLLLGVADGFAPRWVASGVFVVLLVSLLWFERRSRDG